MSHPDDRKVEGIDDDDIAQNGILENIVHQKNSNKHCKQRVFSYCFLPIILVAASVVLAVALTGQANPVEAFIIQEDPPGPNETHKWDIYTSDDGLDLVIENALVDSWTPILEEYVEKWDAGYQTVDPLTLSIRRVEPDQQCDPSPGKLKVCNGDYGPTDWRGINISLKKNGYIVNSVSKMNDHWLLNEGEIAMRYAMCHELGHGFGLTHTDENHWNINTGECMDYTTRPRSNLNPGKFNFDLLADIYGSATRHQGGPVSLRSSRLGKVVEPQTVHIEITKRYRKVVDEVEYSSSCVDCKVDLGDGYEVEFHQMILFE